MKYRVSERTGARRGPPNEAKFEFIAPARRIPGIESNAVSTPEVP